MITTTETGANELFEIIRNDVGSGLTARRDFTRGQAICRLSWTGFRSEPSRWTIQVGDDLHAEVLPEALRYVNHSCNPNVFFDVDRNEFLALRDIAAGDELRYFYPSTEWKMDEPFDCRCGEDCCCGRIAGASQMPLETLRRYRLSGVIRRKLGLRLAAD